MDYIIGFEDYVDQTIEAHKVVAQHSTLLERLKTFFRTKASETLFEGTTIKFKGTVGNLRVTFSKKLSIKPLVDPEQIPEELRKIFFVEKITYKPVDNFSELLEKHPTITQYVEFKPATPTVTVLE
jgi:hypothetical protein